MQVDYPEGQGISKRAGLRSVDRMIAPNQSPSARRFRKERDLSSSWTEPSPGICAWTLMASRPMTSSKAETACGGATHGPWVVVQRPQPGDGHVRPERAAVPAAENQESQR